MRSHNRPVHGAISGGQHDDALVEEDIQYNFPVSLVNLQNISIPHVGT